MDEKGVQKGLKVNEHWLWDNEFKSKCALLSSDQKNVYFFDTISRGTAGVRGNLPLRYGIHYYEILIKEPIYGSSTMFGFGTGDACLHFDNYSYVNMVGYDENSWGLSHRGTVWHNGQSAEYTQPFYQKDQRVGALLNLNNRTVHFYLDGKYLGQAFDNVNLRKDTPIYPMVSSTAIDIELELVKSFKVLLSLEDICYENIHKMFNCYEKLPLAQRFIRNLESM